MKRTPIRCVQCNLIKTYTIWRNGICYECKERMKDILCGRCSKITYRFARNRLCYECVKKQDDKEKNWDRALETLAEIQDDISKSVA